MYSIDVESDADRLVHAGWVIIRSSNKSDSKRCSESSD